MTVMTHFEQLCPQEGSGCQIKRRLTFSKKCLGLFFLYIMDREVKYRSFMYPLEDVLAFHMKTRS